MGGLRVENSDGTSSHEELRYDFYEAPRVERVLPSHGVSAGGAIVTVIGSGYQSGMVQCRFGSAAVGGSAVFWSSSTMVSCVTPGAADGRTGPWLGTTDRTRTPVLNSNASCPPPVSAPKLLLTDTV